MSIDKEIERSLDWGRKRGLHASFALLPQMAKLKEEIAEVENAILVDDIEGVKLEMGDCLVVATQLGAIYCKRFDTDFGEEDFLETCLKAANDKIENRKGKLVDGQFVRDREQSDG